MTLRRLAGAALAVVLLAAAFYVLVPQWFVAPLTALNRSVSNLSEHVVTVDGHEVHYLEGGSGDTVVLLHGIFAEKDHWVEFARTLTPRLRVIAPDLPGFGESSRLDAHSYRYPEQVRRLDEFLQRLGLARVHLAGNSMGGAIAALYAIEHPNRVASVAFIGAPHGIRSDEPSEMQRRIAAGERPLIARTPEEFERVMDMVFAERPFMPRPILLDAADKAMRRADSNVRIWDAQLADPYPLHDKLAGMKAPALALWGEEEQVFHVSGARALQALLPAADVQVMPRTGHLPMMERPAETASRYLAFLDRVNPRATAAP
ncbi:alpha/beta fold hydrolase [Piscinibacter sp.]|uniref:alpha/beta fold hydrolase n=1 Tax=Piscinibacter sp. TaxID=1903157 RepID=UPI002C1D7C32|nr:alpha/beta fold hydrolase [Albitalea sp.]HUG22328.1 alpha/beta fold hydrolase [Albitalea sp.]